jgi:prepilin-type N-terminal cleavage/methylation domain-containing protein
MKQRTKYAVNDEYAVNEECPVNEDRRPRAGFTMIEIMIVVFISVVLVGITVPLYSTITATLRASGDLRDLSGLTAQAKMRAASDFTHARVYADLSGNTFQLEVWNKTGSCWVAYSDPTNTCLTNTGSAPGGTVNNLAAGDTFGFGSLSTPPTVGQTTVGQAGQCQDKNGSAISNTACILFNSRGIPIDPTTLAPRGDDALYITNGTVVNGVTVAATGSIQTWTSGTASGSTWSAQ